MKTDYLVIDCECSGALRNKAHPFDPRNKLLLVGVKSPTKSEIFNIELNSELHLPYGLSIASIQYQINNTKLLVGFNIKYDLHWLRMYGVTIPDEVAIWDCQLAEFILSNQSKAYPSLSETAAKYGQLLKLDTLSQYLGKGVDVDGIPIQELQQYLQVDLDSNEGVYLSQRPLIKSGGYWPLFNMQCQDLKVIQDMEYNGMKYDVGTSNKLSHESSQKEAEIRDKLYGLVNHKYVNWNSNDHVSAVLYGGEIKVDLMYMSGAYKTGPKAGAPKYSKSTTVTPFPRLVEPLKGSELAKEGYWSTARDTLTELKATGVAKQIIKLLLQLSDLDKLRSTYYEGIPKKFNYYNWHGDIMHGQINQCVARTGRTSSSGPNLQNIPPEGKQCFTTRFPI